MDARLRRGLEQFNGGEFFAAHETWEDLWNDSVGMEKQLLQGLVQIAAGYSKVESGIRGGAVKLLSRGAAIVAQFAPSALGLTLNPFVVAVEADVFRVQSASDEATSLATVQPPQLR
jgi:hypothetical protein